MKKCRNFKRKLPNGSTWSGGKYVGVPADVIPAGLLNKWAIIYPNDLLRSYIPNIPAGLTVNEDGSYTYIGDPLDILVDIYRNGIKVIESYREGIPSSHAPTLSSPQAYGVSLQGVIPSVITDEGNGLVYMVVVPDGDSPSISQVKLGQQSSGAQALASRIMIPMTGRIFFPPITNLVSATSYEIYFVQTDSDNNNSALSTVGFTTNAALSGGPAIQPQSNFFLRRE